MGRVTGGAMSASVQTWIALLGTGLLTGLGGIGLSSDTHWLTFFDNLHWTSGTLLAALLGWLGATQSAPDHRRGLQIMATGFTLYAAGQLLWDVQVWLDYRNFPSPSDLFYLWLGPCLCAGLLAQTLPRVPASQRFTLALDCALVAIAALALVLALYLPRSGDTGLLALITLIAYPATLLASLGVGLILIPSQHLKPAPGYLAFLTCLLVTGLCWMLWNLQALNGNAAQGSLANGLFSLSIAGCGAATLFWRLESSTAPRWIRLCEGFLRLIPLLAVIVACTAVAVSQIYGEFSRDVSVIIVGGALAVIALSFLRQSKLLQDYQELQATTRLLKQSEHFNQTILEALPDLVWMKDARGIYLMCNAGIERIYGKPASAIIGKTDFDFHPPQLARFFLQKDREAMHSKGPCKNEEWLTSASDGSQMFVETIKTPVVDAAGSIIGVLGIARDITARHEMEKALKESETRLRLIGDNLPDGYVYQYALDQQGQPHFIYLSAGIERVNGVSAQDVLRNPQLLLMQIDPGQLDAFRAAEQTSARDLTDFAMELRMLRADSSHRWVLLRSHPQRRANGSIVWDGIAIDITLAKYQQETLELMAHYDALTRLPNRILFADRFHQAIAHSRRDNSLLAVCYLDLDGFKQVNDQHGHETGDKLLIEVARRIQSCLREEDTISRMGGDEFALLLGNVKSEEQFENALQRIHQVVSEPYRIDERTLHIAVSSGVTLYPNDDADPDTLIRHADQAMYRAKQEGRNRYFVFDSSHDLEVRLRRDLLDAIERGLQAQEFCLYYQPKVNMRTGEVIGAEALLRWNHPQRGQLLPADFLPLIAGTSLEQTVGEWVIREALQQMTAWHELGLDIKVSINISPRHLQQRNFATHLIQTLAQFPALLAQQLELEVLETGVLEDLQAAGKIIEDCSQRVGISFALDDFGTGYSSLSHMRHLPVNTIKIDHGFVRDMINDSEDRAIVEGVIGLANAFRREVVAEGVETPAHGVALLKLGCELGQGYGIARPMPASQIPGWVRASNRDGRWSAQVANLH